MGKTEVSAGDRARVGRSLDPARERLGGTFDVGRQRRVGDDVIVLKGLNAHQRIVTSANFLIDSESQLQAAAGSYVPPPPGASAEATQRSQSAQLNVEFATDPNPPRKGNNVFHVKLTEAGGTPVDGADVAVTFFMPAMPAMGMAAMKTAINASEKGGGMYEGKGELGSGGTWQVTIRAQQNGQTIASKQITLNAAGGM